MFEEHNSEDPRKSNYTGWTFPPPDHEATTSSLPRTKTGSGFIEDIPGNKRSRPELFIKGLTDHSAHASRPCIYHQLLFLFSWSTLFQVLSNKNRLLMVYV